MNKKNKVIFLAILGGAYYLKKPLQIALDKTVTKTKEVVTMTTGITPRGIRNNNPLNLEQTADNWKGEIVGNDTRFMTFSDAKYGIRAAAKLLINYQRLYNLDTMKKVIDRFAPPFENNTNAYAEHIAESIGVNVNDKITISKNNLLPILRAMIKHENGINPYSDETILSGIELV